VRERTYNPAPMRTLAAEGLTRRFARICAVDGVDLELQQGEVRGLLGLNGAGKTTLLRMLLGLVRPNAGEVELLGRPLGDPLRLEGVAGFVEEPSFYPYLSARANLEVLGRLDAPDDRARSRHEEVLEQVGLADSAEQRVGAFSTGMRKRLGIAAALIRRPRLLLLDEPTAGLDPAGVRFVGELVGRLAGEGVTVLLSSHQIAEVEGACDGFTVLDRGRVVWDGTAAAMREQAPPGAHRLWSSDDATALDIASGRSGVRADLAGDGGLLVEAGPAELDGLVLELGGAGVAVRRLEPVAGPLEAMFFALTREPRGDAPEGRA
jgi:ABC-2 type transport system ATP-binding protein